MPKLLEKIKDTVDATIPDKEELTHGLHPKLEYALLLLRNLFVVLAALFFLASLFAGRVYEYYNILKSIGYFAGAVAYIFECLAVTDCFHTKVPHTEMFMVYCFGPLYILMGLGYILWH